MEQLGLDKTSLPKGLLLDFGGVIVSSTSIPGWQQKLAEYILNGLKEEGVDPSGLTLETIARDIDDGKRAGSHWKHASSRVRDAKEMTYEQMWGDFVSCDWPEAPRNYVLKHAKELCRLFGEYKASRFHRNGIIELLDMCDEKNIPVSIVSNTLMGQVHRDYLIEHNILDRFVKEIYSDEVGVRKPNPEMIRLGAESINVPVEDCWYVGDNYDRDVLCGVRANVGGNVLMPDSGTHKRPYELGVTPHIIVKDPQELSQAILDRLALG